MILTDTIHIIRNLYGESLKDIVIERLVLGVFFTGVKLSTGYGGVSYTPIAELHNNPCCSSMSFQKPGAGNFKGTPVREILNEPAGSPLLNTVRLVILNALSPPFLTAERYKMTYDRDVLIAADVESMKKVAMVGAFTPFLDVFKKRADIELHVIEKKTQSFREDEAQYYVPSEKAGEIIPQCDTVIITGATVANGTIDQLLTYTNPGAKVIVTGPTVSFLPDALFERNVGIVGGTIVTDVDRALDLLAEGAGAYQLFGTCVRKINIMRGNKSKWKGR
jgi:uncharacterized protein (DUF4213/DUF364 family)